MLKLIMHFENLKSTVTNIISKKLKVLNKFSTLGNWPNLRYCMSCTFGNVKEGCNIIFIANHQFNYNNYFYIQNHTILI